MTALAPTAVRLRARLYEHLDRMDLLDPTRAVLVALSGGLDSVTLLHLLRFAPAPPLLSAAHLDHRMRAGSSADADWVAGLCRAWAVPLVTGAANPAPRSEAEGRTVRYAFLEQAADERRAAVIVTAHHADDQAETVLFRLARGTGLSGLAGIPARRGRIMRPLLAIGRAELLAYARAYGLMWRDDPSNLDLRYARNRIRHRVLPLLESARPGAARRIAALARRAAEAEAGWADVVGTAVESVVTEQVGTRLTLARDRLLGYHPHVRARVLRHLLHRLGSRPGGAGTRAALDFIAVGASGARIELAGGITLAREFDRLLLDQTRAPAEPADTPLEIRAPEAGAGTFCIGGRRRVARWGPGRNDDSGAERGGPGPAHLDARAAGLDGAQPGLAASFDLAALRFPLELRGWRPGDRLRFRFGSKKLKELFRERRIGRGARVCAPVLCAADGTVLWVAGVARADVARPSAGASTFDIAVVDGDTL